MNTTMRRALVAAALALACAGTARAADETVTLELRDGTRLVGRVVAEDDQRVRFETTEGLALDVPRAAIVSMRRPGDGAPAAAGGRDPNYSRLMFAPTGRPLKKGDGYFSDYELLFPGLAYGLTDNLTLAGGFSVIPGLGLGEQLFYISPKLGASLSDRIAVSVGGLFAGAGGGDGDGESARIGFAVGTFGGRDASLSVGFGLGDTSSEYSDAVPILMVGGTVTLSRRVALVGETWLFLGDDFRAAEQPFGLAVRFFGERLSADVGFVMSGELLEEGFPMPWVSVTYHFEGK
jgi:hypothetical protein